MKDGNPFEKVHLLNRENDEVLRLIVSTKTRQALAFRTLVFVILQVEFKLLSESEAIWSRNRMTAGFCSLNISIGIFYQLEDRVLQIKENKIYGFFGQVSIVFVKLTIG